MGAVPFVDALDRQARDTDPITIEAPYFHGITSLICALIISHINSFVNPQIFGARAERKRRSNDRLPLFSCLGLCLVENYHIGQACILKFHLVLDAIDFHISALVKSLMVGNVPAQTADLVQISLALVALVLVGDCFELCGGHHQVGLVNQLSLFSGADVHLKLLMTAILGGLKFLMCPTRGDVVAFVDVDVALVLEENQGAIRTSESIVVTEEIALCHSCLLLSFCTLIVSHTFPVVNRKNKINKIIFRVDKLTIVCYNMDGGRGSLLYGPGK